MPIDAKDTLALADMLRIKLSDSEAARFSEDMSSVLDYVRLLDRVDVTGVESMGAGYSGYAELREDVIGESFSAEDLELLSDGRYDVQREAFVTKPIFG